MKSWIKIAIPVVAVVILGGWYAFRPERLVVNRHVDEALPATQGSSSPQPLESGQFYSILHPTAGTATIYQMGDGTRVLQREFRGRRAQTCGGIPKSLATASVPIRSGASSSGKRQGNTMELSDVRAIGLLVFYSNYKHGKAQPRCVRPRLGLSADGAAGGVRSRAWLRVAKL
jgi:hypothetical protein